MFIALEAALLYVAINALIFAFLTLRVIVIRRRERISMGDNDNKVLAQRIRAHANFTETTPIALIALIGLALLGAPPLLIHGLGATFTLGRLLHCYGMMGKNAVGIGRVIGMVLTLGVIIVEAALLLWKII